MKPALLLLLMCAAYSVNAQVKSDTNSIAHATVKVSAHTDTIPCWFKELKPSSYSYGWFRTVKDSSYKEVWQHGYVIKAQSVAYLYSDRKTMVKNRVTDSFEHKPASKDIK